MAKKSSPNKIVRDAPAVTPGMMRSSKSEEAQEKKWRAESDLHTLASAEEIRRDKARHAAAKKAAADKAKCMTEIARK